MPLRNVATNYTFEQQRQEINLLAADVDAIANQQGTETTDSPTFNSVFLGSTLYGPTLFTIDPATHGDDTGTLVVKGNLQIDGTTTTVNSTTMTVNDLNITLADGASNAAAADGAGLTVDGAGATLLYNGTTDEWAFNKSLTSLSVSGTSTFNASPLGAANVGVLIDGASGAVVTAATGTNSLFKGFTQGTNTATVNIKANGSAEFASGNLFLNFVNDGANIVARNDSNNNPVYEVYKGGLTANDRTVRINSDGTATFADSVRSDEGFVVYPPSDSNYAFATRNAANDTWTAYITAGGFASLDEQLTIGSGSAANSEYGLIAYANSSSLSNRSAVYARNLNAGGRTFTGDNDTGATTFEVFGNGNVNASGTINDSIGNVRRLGLVAATSTFTIASDHEGKFIRQTTAGQTMTVPANVFGIGTMITIVNRSSGTQTIAQGSGVTMYNSADGSTGNRTLAANGMCTLLFTASNEVYISGAGLS